MVFFFLFVRLIGLESLGIFLLIMHLFFLVILSNFIYQYIIIFFFLLSFYYLVSFAIGSKHIETR